MDLTTLHASISFLSAEVTRASTPISNAKPAPCASGTVLIIAAIFVPEFVKADIMFSIGIIAQFSNSRRTHEADPAREIALFWSSSFEITMLAPIKVSFWYSLSSTILTSFPITLSIPSMTSLSSPDG